MVDKKLKKDKKDNKIPEKAKNSIDFTPTTDEQSIVEYALDGDLSDMNEHIEALKELLEDLSVTQRLKKKRVMKKFKAKIKVARRKSMRRRANTKTINKRARRQAISNVKKFLTKGKSLKNASASEKNRIERMVKKRKGLIDRSARKLRIGTRKKERARFQKSDVTFTGNELVETFDVFYKSKEE
ncbi:MAG: hypothetical protein COA52_01075 [Hyphomicrobiales bacterium]|nr:MAG: hypothetical protein COA52_01075 [Hyphomicrobiales bacterium]